MEEKKKAFSEVDYEAEFAKGAGIPHEPKQTIEDLAKQVDDLVVKMEEANKRIGELEAPEKNSDERIGNA